MRTPLSPAAGTAATLFVAPALAAGAPEGISFADWDAFLRLCFGAKNKTMRSIFRNKNVVAMLLEGRQRPGGATAADSNRRPVEHARDVKGGDSPAGSLVPQASVATAWGTVDRAVLDAARDELLAVFCAVDAALLGTQQAQSAVDARLPVLHERDQRAPPPDAAAGDAVFAGTASLRPNATPIATLLAIYRGFNAQGYAFAPPSGWGGAPGRRRASATSPPTPAPGATARASPATVAAAPLAAARGGQAAAAPGTDLSGAFDSAAHEE